METSQRSIKVALIQLKVSPILLETLTKAEKYIQEAKQNGAELIVLPEYINVARSTKGDNQFEECAEAVPEGPTCQMLIQAAKNNSVHIVGGTLIERNNSNLYNTCTVWNPNGELIAKFRKIHLFDVDIPGGIVYKESNSISPGSELATFFINGVKVGLGICHDLRFEELARQYRLQDCEILIYPSKFSLTTGPLHFELLQRARAVDNQVFVIGVSPARGDRGHVAWGYSQVTSPWGKVLVQGGYEEQLLFCELNLSLCDEVRQQIPLESQRRLPFDFGTKHVG